MKLGYKGEPLANGLSFCLPSLEMQELNYGKTARSVHSVRLDESSKKIRITFFPVAIHLCEAKFKEQNEVIPFKQESSTNAPSTTRVPEQWSCLLDPQEWTDHKEALITLASTVYTEWEARRNINRV